MTMMMTVMMMTEILQNNQPCGRWKRKQNNDDDDELMTATTTNLMIWQQWRSSFQKWTAGAAVLDFTVEEWESLYRLMEANAAEMSKFAVADNNKNNTGTSEMENRMIGGDYDEGAV